MRRQRTTASLSAGYVLTFIGVLLALIGFWLPWVVIRPKSMFGDILSLFGSALGGIGGFGRHLAEATSIHFSGWALSTGVTAGDLMSQIGGGWGQALTSMSQADPSTAAALSQQVISPMVWLFLFPLLAIIALILLFMAAGRGVPKPVLILGITTLVLISASLLLTHIFMQKAMSQMSRDPSFAIANALGQALMETKIGTGVWLIIIGSILWIIGGIVAPSTGHIHSGRTPRRPSYSHRAGTSLSQRRSRRPVTRRIRSRRW